MLYRPLDLYISTDLVDSHVFETTKRLSLCFMSLLSETLLTTPIEAMGLDLKRNHDVSGVTLICYGLAQL